MRQSASGLWTETADLAGHTVGRIAMPDRMSPLGISREGDRILGIKLERSAPLMIMPVDGGPARRLGEAHSYDEPLASRPNGRRVFFRTAQKDKRVLIFVPATAGSTQKIKLPEAASDSFTPILSHDGNRLLKRMGVVKGLRIESGSIFRPVFFDFEESY